MKNIYRHSEIGFEKLTSVATTILGNSITFIAALALVAFWLTDSYFYHQELHHSVGEIILSITFLSLFIIQKSFNRFSALLHLKINELVSSHEPASNTVLNVEKKTEHEIALLSKGYSDIDEPLKDEITG